MRKIFTGLSGLLALMVAAQFFLAASGAFDTAPREEAFQPHRLLGYAIGLVAILVTIAAAVARMPGRLIGMAGLIAPLVVVQSLIRTIAGAFEGPGDASTTAGKWIFGLHAINAMIIVGLTLTIRGHAQAGQKSTGRDGDVVVPGQTAGSTRASA